MTPGEQVVSFILYAIVFGFLILMYILIAKVGGYFWATFIMAVAFLKVYLEEREKNKR